MFQHSAFPTVFCCTSFSSRMTPIKEGSCSAIRFLTQSFSYLRILGAPFLRLCLSHNCNVALLCDANCKPKAGNSAPNDDVVKAPNFLLAARVVAG